MEDDTTYRQDLDDASKTCIYIPPGKHQNGVHDSTDDDHPEDHAPRMQAYRAAWGKCLNRVQHILRTLQASAVREAINQVADAHDNVLPGIPYPELPLIALHGANSSLAEDISRRLGSTSVQKPNDFSHETSSSRALQVHLHPADCSSVMNMMKGIVTGFVDAGARRKTTSSLANFDINLLRAWYASQAPGSKLVVFLHEFERFDPAVLQDVFYISSMYIPQIPLVFILLMASPPVPSYLHAAYPRSTLALLRVHSVNVSSGLATVMDVLTKTFFDPDFQPDVMIGPGALEFIADFTTRHTASPDALVTLLQLVHMKHYTQPLSIFTQGELLGEADTRTAERKLNSEPGLQSLVQGLQLRLFATSSPAAPTRAGSSTPSSPRKTNGAGHDSTWRAETAGELLGCVSRARVAFGRQARRMRVGYAVARIAEQVALGAPAQHAAKSAEGSNARLDSLGMLSAVLRGRAGAQVRYVCMAVRKLPLPKLRELLSQLHAFLWDLKSAEVKRDEEDARVWIVTTLNQLPPESNEPEAAEYELQAPQDPAVKQLAAAAGDWLQGFIEERLVRLDEQVLWDIWYTGNTPFPSELVNPAPRPTVVSALLHPHDFARAHAELVRATTNAEPSLMDDDDGAREPALWELPDTSIAFRRYVEAGRMVNVYDWFESFAVVLEAQRRKLRRRAQRAARRTPTNAGRHTPRSRTKRRGGKADMDMDVDVDERRAEDDSDEEIDEEMDEEEEEKWKIEVQARFMRALHELDYMGDTHISSIVSKPHSEVRNPYTLPCSSLRQRIEYEFKLQTVAELYPRPGSQCDREKIRRRAPQNYTRNTGWPTRTVKA